MQSAIGFGAQIGKMLQKPGRRVDEGGRPGGGFVVQYVQYRPNGCHHAPNKLAEYRPVPYFGTVLPHYIRTAIRILDGSQGRAPLHWCYPNQETLYKSKHHHSHLHRVRPQYTTPTGVGGGGNKVSRGCGAVTCAIVRHTPRALMEEMRSRTKCNRCTDAMHTIRFPFFCLSAPEWEKPKKDVDNTYVPHVNYVCP